MENRDAVALDLGRERRPGAQLLAGAETVPGTYGREAPKLGGYIVALMPTPRSRLAVIFLTVLIDLIGFGIILPILPYYAQRFGAVAIEAYGPLILDAMRGDQTLFQHRYEVEGAWRAVMPLLGPESEAIRRNLHANYPPGSWGPPAADRLLTAHGRAWHNP